MWEWEEWNREREETNTRCVIELGTSIGHFCRSCLILQDLLRNLGNIPQNSPPGGWKGKASIRWFLPPISQRGPYGHWLPRISKLHMCNCQGGGHGCPWDRGGRHSQIVPVWSCSHLLRTGHVIELGSEDLTWGTTGARYSPPRWVLPFWTAEADA